MNTQLLDQETVLKNGKANLQRGLETVGGELFLTNMRLIFEPHKANIQTKTETVALSDIKKIGLGSTKFLKIIPISPNVFTVRLDDRQLDFSVGDRKEWAETVSSHLSS